MTWIEAIRKVLEDSHEPLHYTDIAEEIARKDLRKKVGATPARTVNGVLTDSIKSEGDSSPFIKMTKGIYALRKQGDSAGGSVLPNSLQMPMQEEPNPILTSFGMFWRRINVAWKPTPQLLGSQGIVADPVDFYEQRGLYLLYDGREVLYVGRATERPLGKRLYEHTKDRMSARWDRFSWFGILPVSEKGKIGSQPETYSANMLIPSLEAILIESLEPRQNRQRGEDMADREYIQRIAPEIRKKRIKDMVDDIS